MRPRPPSSEHRLPQRPDRRLLLQVGARSVAASWLSALVPGLLAGETDEAVVGLVPFVGEGSFPVERTVGAGLGKRRSLDLSTLTPASLVTPTERFFIRTGCPVRLPDLPSWKVKVHGLALRPQEIPLGWLQEQAVDQGVHLLECAGNSRGAHFGFMGVARWGGAPLWPLLEKAGPGPRATQVLVSGWDEHDVQDRGSVPGASWIFGLERLRQAGAFLATSMNGGPLSPDHGFPLRLVVPGWYGAVAIKWVNEIVLLDDQAPATDHMLEYAGRTHQTLSTLGPPLARDFEPATLDPSATAVRVEKRRGRDGKVSYRIVGILWGGSSPGDRGALQIRTHPDRPFMPVELVGAEGPGSLTLWSHTFRPEKPGRYEIALRLTGTAARTRRLDAGFYSREIEIVEVALAGDS